MGGKTVESGVLKEYIKRVYQLEALQYEQKALCKKIARSIQMLREARGKPLEQKESYDIVASILVAGWGGGAAASFYLIFYLLLNTFRFPGFMPLLVIFIVVTAAILIIIMVSKALTNQKVERRNQIIQAKNQTTQHNRDLLCQELERRLEAATGNLRKTQVILGQYYQKGIIYQKYRNFIAVSSFYEYLESGRCSTLEGHEGAYNTFENEIRQNLILTKLDEIIVELKNIQRNQYMLYTAIEQSNRKLDKYNKNMMTLKENSEITAYNSSITAQNSEFLTWLEIWK